MALNEYWMERGAHYYANEARRLEKPFYQQQAKLIVHELQRWTAPESILDLGCGYGRITKELRSTFPNARIIGIDLSPAQIAEAFRYCPGVDFVRADFYCEELPKVDVAVAVEVLLHVPPAQLAGLLGRIFKASPVLLHDFDPQVIPGDPTGPHCFAHDYANVYRRLGISAEMATYGPHGVIRATRENDIHQDLVRAASPVGQPVA